MQFEVASTTCVWSGSLQIRTEAAFSYFPKTANAVLLFWPTLQVVPL